MPLAVDKVAAFGSSTGLIPNPSASQKPSLMGLLQRTKIDTAGMVGVASQFQNFASIGVLEGDDLQALLPFGPNRISLLASL